MTEFAYYVETTRYDGEKETTKHYTENDAVRAAQHIPLSVYDIEHVEVTNGDGTVLYEEKATDVYDDLLNDNEMYWWEQRMDAYKHPFNTVADDFDEEGYTR